MPHIYIYTALAISSLNHQSRLTKTLPVNIYWPIQLTFSAGYICISPWAAATSGCSLFTYIGMDEFLRPLQCFTQSESHPASHINNSIKSLTETIETMNMIADCQPQTIEIINKVSLQAQ